MIRAILGAEKAFRPHREGLEPIPHSSRHQAAMLRLGNSPAGAASWTGSGPTGAGAQCRDSSLSLPLYLRRHAHETTDWFQIGKGVRRGCILSPCLFNLYAEYIMRNAELEETQAGIKIAVRNINNLRYADDTTLMAESEEELKSLLMKVKEESVNWLTGADQAVE